MIRRLLSGFGLLQNQEIKIVEDKTEINRLKLELGALQKKRRQTIPVLEIGIDLPEPKTEEERIKWAGEWARFYKTYLASVLRHKIALVREELDWAGYRDSFHQLGLPEGMTRSEYDAYLRGTSNAFKLLMEYGEQMVAEDFNYSNNNK